MTSLPATMRQIRSTVTDSGQVQAAVVSVAVPHPGPEEVLVRVEATPVNPSDLGLLFAGADLTTVAPSGTAAHPVVTADLPPGTVAALAGRVGHPLPVGNEGAGVVVAAGESPAAQALLGRTVAVFGGAMYAEYRCIAAAQCLVLPDGTDPRDGASCFVNPLTALGMVETMRHEGHRALVHTAAASNLGRMLVKICEADGVGLVNVVRRPAQAELLRELGARWVCDSSSPGFHDELTTALQETGATIAFDAVGGGALAAQLLAAMEAAIGATHGGAYSRYGSSVHKQVYLYGNLDRGPTVLARTFGMAWSVGGWLLPNFLEVAGHDVAARLRQRVVDELHTTFASGYARELSLTALLDPAEIADYATMSTDRKVLLLPQESSAPAAS